MWTTAARMIIGGLFVGHGMQKLTGAFGGHGPDGTGGFFESLGLRPGRRHALTAGAAEAGGGALLALGALTPLSTSVLSATMITAVRKAHLQNGPWVTNGGYEYNLVLVAALTALAETGPGRPSVDGALLPRLHGPAVAAASLGAAVAGSYLATGPLNAAEPPAEQEGEQVQAVADPAVGSDGRFTRQGAGTPQQA